MSAIPTPYVPASNFSSDMAANAGLVPSNEGVKWDAEFAALQVFTAAQQARLNQITRSDGSLGTKVVSLDALGTDVAAAIGVGLNGRGAWATLTLYAKGDVIASGGISYLCVAAHTSAATFAADLAVFYWVALTSVVIGTGSISSSSMFAAAVVDNTALALLSVGTGNIQALAVTGAKIAANVITGGASGHLALATITDANMVALTITKASIANGVTPIIASTTASVSQTTTTLADVTGLSIPILASQSGTFEAHIGITAAAGGGVISVAAPAGATGSIHIHYNTTSLALFGFSATSGAVFGSNFSGLAVSITGFCRITGTITNSVTAGNLKIQYASVTGGNTTTIAQGSILKFQ